MGPGFRRDDIFILAWRLKPRCRTAKEKARIPKNAGHNDGKLWGGEPAAGTFVSCCPSEHRQGRNGGERQKAQAGCDIGQHVFACAARTLRPVILQGGIRAARTAARQNCLYFEFMGRSRRRASINAAAKCASRRLSGFSDKAAFKPVISRSGGVHAAYSNLPLKGRPFAITSIGGRGSMQGSLVRASRSLNELYVRICRRLCASALSQGQKGPYSAA